MRRTFASLSIRPSMHIVLLVAFLAGLPACTGRSAAPIASQGNLPTLAPFATITPPRPATSTITSEPPPTATTTPLPTATITPAPVIDLPGPLYVLAEEEFEKGGPLMLLKPGASAAVQVPTASEAISRFDLSPVDGRLAFGTVSGKIFVINPGEEPKMVADPSMNASHPVTITGLQWSPDGQRLAYTVAFQQFHDAFQKAEYPVEPTGVWVLDLDDPNPLWLLSNSYLDVGWVSLFYDPVWSPDGKALAVERRTWEHNASVWFYPIQPVQTIYEAHETEYIDFSWATDSKGLFLGAMGYTDYVNLIWSSRENGDMELLLDGPKMGWWIGQPYALDTGIAFFAVTDTQRKSKGMFYGRYEADTFIWSKIDHSPLCRENAHEINVHHTGENVITLLCDKTDLRLIEPTQNTFRKIDLAPFMERIKGAVIQIHWGVD